MSSLESVPSLSSCHRVLLAAGGMILLASLAETRIPRLLCPLLRMGGGMVDLRHRHFLAVRGVPRNTGWRRPASRTSSSADRWFCRYYGRSTARFDAVRPRPPTPATLPAATTARGRMPSLSAGLSPHRRGRHRGLLIRQILALRRNPRGSPTPNEIIAIQQRRLL